jgi:signal transduction histidine kinase
LSQELAAREGLSAPAQQALEEIFSNPALSERVVSFKIWKEGGLVVHASDPSIIGATFPPSDDLRAAWQGEISGSFGDLDHEESQGEAALGVPLLEVYSPIREAFSGRIIAVAEFYERAEGLSGDLADARRSSWLVVSATFLASGLLLFGIVNAGGRVIRMQGEMLQARLKESNAMARQNAALRARVVDASARATAQADRYLRRLGSDLHDGPAQHLALAAMRLDRTLAQAGADPETAADVRNGIGAAMTEIRAISRGLAIPDLDQLDLHTVISRAVTEHADRDRPGPVVHMNGDVAPTLGYSAKLCAFRFVQEALSNAARHAPGASVALDVAEEGGHVVIMVTDDGPGFDPASAMQVRDDGGQGLLGLVDRAESIGGELSIDAKPGRGTRLKLTLPLTFGDAT